METQPLPGQQPLLPDDVIHDILSRLPVKTLMRFKCICRSWKSIITFDPFFVKLHLERSPKNANIILQLAKWYDLDEYDDVLHSIVTPYYVTSWFSSPPSTMCAYNWYLLGDYHWAFGSCNGLVSLVGSNFSLKGAAGNGYQFRFWNPATRKTSRYSPSLSVVKDKQCSFGFGYDQSSDSYKVVVVILDMKVGEDSEKTKVKVHKMGDTLWRDIGSFPAVPVKNEGGVYVSVACTLNWLGVQKLHGVDRLVIVSLDLRKETFGKLLLPDGLDEVPNVGLVEVHNVLPPVLGVLMDCLCLFGDDNRTHFVLWQMKEYGVKKSWTRLMSVSYQRLRFHPSPFNPEEHQLSPVCVSEDDNVLVLLSAAFADEELAIIKYHRKEDIIEHTRIHEERLLAHPKNYIQSLVLPLPL